MTQEQAAARFGDRDVSIDPAQAARVLAQIDRDELVAFLQALVRVPSVNPPGDTREAIRVVEEKLAAEGFATVVVGPTPEKQSIVATLEGQGAGPRLAFNAHVDVVPIGEESAWEYPPFGGEIHDGRVYGRGAGDDKASVTAQVMAAIALARSGVPFDGALLVTEVADEEVGGAAGAGYIVQNGHVKADFAIVGEQTFGQICVGERGGAPVKVTVFGKTGHAATPWKGVNAIEGIARVITALREELWPRLAAHAPVSQSIDRHDQHDRGGVKTNVIPDRASIHVDRRILPGETPEGGRGGDPQIAERAIADVPGLRVETSAPIGRLAIEADPQSAVGRALQAATHQIGKELVLTGFFAGTDGKHFASAGIPTLIMGPGDPATAHTPNEWVGIDEVIEATQLYALAALALLGRKDS